MANDKKICKIPIPMKTIPMDLDESFTPAELLTKICFKINEIISGFDNLNKKIDDLDIDNLNQRIDNLNNKIDVEIADLREHINLEAERVLLEAKQYTDQRINEILNYKTISAKDYDNLGMTAQTYDSMNITAYRYDTESAQILIISYHIATQIKRKELKYVFKSNTKLWIATMGK